ncbi:MAG: hypothetical protein NTX88_07635, partial [Candidatus Atribacteria bacterium]|nr:hypothetical protein [Candidatus Atribacteria bacterium]
MIPVTQDLIHSIASERQIPLRVIPQIYELKSVPASLLPVKSPEENFIAVFTRERKTFLELPWLHDFREVNGQYIMIYPFSFPNYQRLARELPILKPS